MKRFLLTVHAVFVLVGIANTMLGPLLPLLAQRWQLTDRQSGALFFAQFFGGFAGAIISTRLAKQFSLHNITRAGLGLIAAGVLGLATPSQLLAIVGITMVGFGLGLTNPSITAAVAEAFPTRRASLLNLLNFAWALGAITAPMLILAALRHSHLQVSGMLLIYAVILSISAFLIPRIPASSFSREMTQAKLPSGILRIVIACGALLFLYVGIEVGISGWLPTFATRMQAFSLPRAALLQDTFWTTFLLGRLFAPVFLNVTGERLLLTLSICTATAGTLALLLLHLPIVLFVSVAMIGLGCAAVFPTAIALLSQRLSGYSGSTLGFMFASAGLGAAILPFCIGSLSSATHNLRIGMSLLLVAEIGLVIAHLVMSRFSSGAGDALFDSAQQKGIATGGAQ